MENDWKLQASFKFGRSGEAMLNVRANSPQELDATCEAVNDVVGTLVVLQEAFRAESVVTESFPGTTRVGTQSNTAPATRYNENKTEEAPPTCGPDGSHGFMVKKEAKGLPRDHKDYWWGWFCPLPAGPGRCKAVYPNKR